MAVSGFAQSRNARSEEGFAVRALQGGGVREWPDFVQRALAVLPKPCYLLAAGSPEKVSNQLLLSCAVQAQKKIAVDAGATRLIAAGLPVDVLIGDFDSLDAASLADLRAEGVEAHRFPAQKDQTDLQLALAYAVEQSVGSVVVIGALGGRLDHELAVLGACATVCSCLDIVIVNDDTIVWLKSSGGCLTLGAHLEAGRTFSVLPLGGSATLSEAGTKWELDAVQLKSLDPRGISNVVQNSDARIVVHRGIAAIIVPRMV